MNNYHLFSLARKFIQVGIFLAVILFNLGPAGTNLAKAVTCYTLTLVPNPAAGGTISANPLPNCGGTQYTSGTVVTLTGLPEAGYIFGAWQGSITGTLNPNNVVMSADKSITAIFLADQWQKAIDISVPYSVTVNTTLANSEDVNEPQIISCDGRNIRGGKATIWYKYTPASSALVSLDTLGSFQTVVNPETGLVDAYDTYISVWTGTIDTNPSDGNPTLIACNDDTTSGFVSQVGFNAIAGTTYYIQVAQFRGLAGTSSDPYYNGGTLNFHVGFIAQVDVTIGTTPMGSYSVYPGSEKREYYNVSGGPLKVNSTNAVDLVSAIRLQSFANNTLYSFVETMGVPQGSLSYKYYFPTYNNTWAPLNSQLRFANLDANATTIRVTIGTTVVWEQSVAGRTEQRLYFPVSGGPVIVESLDTSKKIIAAIRLQSYDANTGTLYSFAETMGIPVEQLSYAYYFPTYNNTWAPLNSQLRFANLDASATTIRVTIGSTIVWEQSVAGQTEQRLYFPVSGGPVKVESLNTSKKIVAAIRLQSYVNNTTLYSFVETMGVPAGLLSYKYYFPTYNNTWPPLNSQIRFANLESTTTRIRVTIGNVNVWEQDVPGREERRLYFPVSGGPVIIESLDTSKKIVAAIRLQSYASDILYSFAETMGIPFEQLSDTYYFPTYNNTWAPLNSQLRFGVP